MVQQIEYISQILKNDRGLISALLEGGFRTLYEFVAIGRV